MAKFDKATIETWRTMAGAWLAERGYTIEQITAGVDAWAVFARAINTRDNNVYADRSVIDAHIQTALQQVFPNVVFKDAKRY